MNGRKVVVFYFVFLFSFSLVSSRRVWLFWYILYWQVIFAPSSLLTLLVPPPSLIQFIQLPPLISFPLHHLYLFHPLANCFFTAWLFFNQSCLYPIASTLSFNYPNKSLISSFHLNIPSSQDPTAMSSPSGVDHAVIGGVVAVIVFILLCLLIIFGRYLIRHKGRLLAL